MDITDILIYFALYLPVAVIMTRNLQSFLPGTSTIKIIFTLTVIIVNPYLFKLSSLDVGDSIHQICVVLFLLTQINKEYQNSLWSFISIGVTCIINPSNVILAIQGVINSKQSRKIKILGLAVGALTASILLFLYSAHFSFSSYRSIFFPQTFVPQANLLWLLYAHVPLLLSQMFQRYLYLYQLCFLIMNLSSSYLVNHLRVPSQVKLVILLFFRLFCNYQCSQFCLLNAMAVEIIIFIKFLPKLISKMHEIHSTFDCIKIKLLTGIALIGQTSQFIVTRIFLEKYKNDHTMNAGFMLVYFGLLWGFRSIYLSEIVSTTVSFEEDLSKKKTELTQCPLRK